jgi:hypothetical protein
MAVQQPALGEAETRPRISEQGTLPLDAAIVPCGLLLIARELVLFQPTRELAWQLFHDMRVERKSAWLGWLLPHPSAALDADPIALLLAALASGLALVYLIAGWRGARVRVRGALLALAATVVVVLPTVLFIGLGVAMKLPYGHDGGVVQLPLAMDKVLDGESPYGADYTHSVLGRQSRNSEFWAPLGGNPITRHHWYLPGVHLVMIPPYVLSRAVLGFFDPRMITLLGYLLAAWLASLLVEDPSRRLAAAAVVLVHPLVFWPQVFGVNDVLSAVPLLLACLSARSGRTRMGAFWVGLACAFKQLCWPFAPFLLVLLSGVTSWRELLSRAGLRRLLVLLAIAGGTCIAIVAPLAARDWHAFYADIFQYQVGLPGSDQYPLGGTPGFGFANFLIYFGVVHNLSDSFPFSRFYVLFIPLGLALLHVLLRKAYVSTALLCGSAALLTSVYFSRIPNPNYMLLAAILVPLAVIVDRRWPADIAIATVALLAIGTEYPVRELMRTVWWLVEHPVHEIITSAPSGMPGPHDGVPGLPLWLAPGAGPRWRDPLSLVLGSAAAGFAIVVLVTGVLGAGRRLRRTLLAVVACTAVVLPTWIVMATNATGLVKLAQDRWFADSFESAPRTMEPFVHPAWSTSFHKTDTQDLAGPPTLPARAVLRDLRAWSTPADIWPASIDFRWLSLVALTLAAVVLAHSTLGSETALATLLLAPAMAVGVVFGAGEIVILALLLGAWQLAGASRGTAASISAGLAAGLGWQGLGAGLALPSDGTRRLRTAWILAATLFLPFVWYLWRQPQAVATLLSPAAPPTLTLGIFNVFAYWGLEGPFVRWFAAAMWLAFALAAIALAWRGPRPSFATAAVGSLAAVWLLPAEPHAIAVPIVLIVLAALPQEPAAG